MFKRFLAILCCIAVLSFSCILTPASKASRMQIEAEASVGVFVAGVTLAVVVCVVLLWYGISVTTDSTDAQSCVDFVKEKAEAAGIAASTLSLYAFMYMEQIGEWVADWVAAQSEIYTTSSFDFSSFGSTIDGVYYSDCNISLVLDYSFYSSICHSISISCDDSDCKYSLYYYYPGRYPYFGVISSSASPITFTIQYWLNSTESDLKTYSFTLTPAAVSGYNSLYRATFSYSGSTQPESILANTIIAKAGLHSVSLNSTFYNSVASHLGSLPSISADVNKEVVIPAAKDVFDGTGSLEDYQLDNPDVIDFGSALSQLQSSTGNPALTWEDVIGGVNTGEIPVSDVLDATDTVPYVLTDSRTGELADADTPAEFVKPVALTDQLAIPDAQTISDSDPYTPKHNKNDDMGKYRLPLFQFFPFCLPYDLYDFLSKLDVEACAPVWEIDTTPLFKHLRFFKADDGYKITIDLSKYDDIFSIIRVFECIGIVVGFVFVSRKLIHGGD